MKQIRFTTIVNPDPLRLQTLLNADPAHPHIHAVDMPYRLTSTWQDHGCELGLWQKDDQLLAWAVFQPPWWNLDYAMHPSVRGTSLETEIFTWGHEQMKQYASRTGDSFYGSVEFFADAPKAAETAVQAQALGFQKFEWSIIRFEMDLQQTLPQPQLPAGFTVRPLRGEAEVAAYVNLHRAAFESEIMTESWRRRTLAHPFYKPEIDLVVVNPDGELVGFCVCWLWQDIGHIEPLGVHPDYQGQGLGRALELTALQTLRSYGAGSMYVDHRSFNEAAIALSLQTGFKQIHDAVRYFIAIP
jgi:mycothiol synthase